MRRLTHHSYLTMNKYIAMVALAISLFVSCNGSPDENAETVVPVPVYREKEYTLAEIAFKLLNFEKYDVALELVKNDTSYTANGVRTHAYDALGNTHAAIRYAIPYLRIKDTVDFYEGSYECCDLYDIFKKDAEYGLEVLDAEYKRCHSNYQVRQLMMKLYWYLDDYDTVVRMGDEFREELPDMSNEVTFNYWRQSALDALDSLKRVSIE